MAKLRPNQFTLPSGQVITEHPILFQTEMVQAILEDRKTQTRRTKGLDKYPELNWVNSRRINGKDFIYAISELEKGFLLVRPPYGQPGDLLWVKETMILNKNSNTYWPKADGYYHSGSEYEKTVPSIYLPKTASRIWAMVEDIRVERVQDISEENAKAEGIERWVETRMKSQPFHYRVYDHSDPEALYTSCPIDSFQSLWISINGEDSWNSNPWVWVIKFRVLSKIGRPSLEVIEKNYSEILSGSAPLRETRKEVTNG